jgi:hypothetical protein
MRLAAGALLMAASMPAAAQADQATDIAVRMVAQEGLAIALASNVLQSQLNILVDIISYGAGSKGCTKLAGGGSGQVLSYQQVNQSTIDATAAIYYDDACKTPYIQAMAQVTDQKVKGGSAIVITETATYDGPSGTPLGGLTLNESATSNNADTKLVLIGLGQFAPANGAPSVDLGLTCTIPSSAGNTEVLPCQGGIAQNFPSLNVSLASVTPLTLTVDTSGKTEPVNFAGRNSDRQTGALGALSITEASKDALGIGGAGTVYGPADTKGHAANFALFPPPPTHWDIVDKAHGVKFSLKVANGKSRNCVGTVTALSGAATLAKIAVDQSGTGTIAYTGETSQAVTSWLLAD